MDTDRKIGRRTHLRQLSLGAGVVALYAAGCGAKGGDDLVCTDTSRLSGPELATRNQLEYKDKSPNPSQNCTNCRFYTVPQAAGTCGGCILIKGPIHPLGHCKSWVVKA